MDFNDQRLFDDFKVFDDPKVFSITVVDFDDSKVFNDPKVISDVSVGFGNSKVRGDTIPLSSMVLYESEKVKLWMKENWPPRVVLYSTLPTLLCERRLGIFSDCWERRHPLIRVLPIQFSPEHAHTAPLHRGQIQIFPPPSLSLTTIW